MSSEENPKPVGYVLRKFPVLSETFILNEILALEDRGVQVHIFSLLRPNDPYYHKNLARLKAPISYVPGPTEWRRIWRYNRQSAKRFGSRYYRSLWSVLLKGKPLLLWRFLQGGFVAARARRNGITHLHAHFATRASTVAMFVSDWIGVPFSFTAHAYDIYKKSCRKGHIRAKLRKARFVVTISEANVNYLQALNGVPTQNIRLVRNGIDLGRFRPAENPPMSVFTVLSVGRLIEKKGHRVLIKACSHMRDDGCDFRCLIVGQGQLQPELLEMIDGRTLQGRVELLGALPQDEVLALYHQAHLFVLASIIDADGNREGLPVSISEALACGLPVISTPVAGIPEIVADHHNGLIVASGDARALAGAIRSVMEDRNLYERLRTNARSSVLQRYDQDGTAAELERLFSGEMP